jgi:hypothetical protein
MPKDQQQPQQKTIAPGTVVQRSILFERTAIDETSRTVQLAFASETPYERFFGIEILDCAPTSMRMGRLTSGGPLLADHNSRDQIGVVESVSIGADRVEIVATSEKVAGLFPAELFVDLDDLPEQPAGLLGYRRVRIGPRHSTVMKVRAA